MAAFELDSSTPSTPIDAAALWGRGAVYFELGNYEMAALNLDAAIVRSKEYGSWHKAAKAEGVDHLLAQPYVLSLLAHIYLGDDPASPVLREYRRTALTLGYELNVLDGLIEKALASR